MRLDIATLAERPDREPLTNRFHGAWPEFMYHDPTGALYYDLAHQVFADYVLVAVDADHPDRVVAKAYSAPLTLPDVLPDDGWDGVVRAAVADHAAGRRGAQASALEITIQPDLRGKGLAGIVLDAMRTNARRLGHDTLVAPVRPSAKSQVPTEPIRGYAWRTRTDGLPVDPWLRVHVRAGAAIERVAPCSMTIPASLERWRAWTGLPFDTAGPVIVPGALVPVQCTPDQDTAVYVEPNVWVRHRL